MRLRRITARARAASCFALVVVGCGATDAGTDAGSASNDATAEKSVDLPDVGGDPMFTTILDPFDRADGPLDSSGVSTWVDDANQALPAYAVVRGELSCTGTLSAPVWWNAYYGGSATVAEAFITLRQLSPATSDFSLLLVSQTFSPCDFIQVRYDPAAGTIAVSSCQLGTSTSYGSLVNVGQLDDRRLGARFETPAGKLTVYVDATVLGTWTIDQWRYLGRPGRIGLWVRRTNASAVPDRFDDFGGR